MAGVFCFNDLKELCKSKERSLVEEYDRYQAHLEKRVEEYDRYQAYLEKRAEEWAATRAKEESSISEEEKEARKQRQKEADEIAFECMMPLSYMRAQEEKKKRQQEAEAAGLEKPVPTEREKRNRQEYLEFMQTLALDIEERNERAAREEEEYEAWCAETMTPFEKTK